VTHTLKVIGIGLLLLALCWVAGRALGAPRWTAVEVFLPLWLVGAAINMWFGVSRAGYSVREEIPFFLIVFAVPAGIALGLAWLATRRAR
jgi:hypothetical protein